MSKENNWIKSIAKGDEYALEKLYNEYSSKIYNTAIGYTKSVEDAEEVLQDVFVTIFSTASKFRFDAKVSTWIYRIAVNKSLDFLRKKSSQKRQGIFTSIFKSGTTEILHESVDFVHPGVKLENQENAKLLFSVIDGLAENQKTAFILTQMEGLPQNEVAEIMKISRKAVESLLQRAKSNLRVALEKYYPERGKHFKNTTK
ncbi:RNA polymerase sigma factor [Ekhidna sp.]